MKSVFSGHWPLSLLVFLSSFLMFQLELMIGKLFLPNFGGSYVVWGACIVFFQTVLLVGYSGVYFVYRRFGIRVLQIVFLTGLVLSFLAYPLYKVDLLFEAVQASLVVSVFMELVTTIGLAFLVLSMTSVLCQYWAQQLPDKDEVNVYHIFAVSNLGSFLALLAYPFLMEPYMGLQIQQDVWAIVYYLFAALFIYLLFKLKPEKTKTERSGAIKLLMPTSEIINWLVCSAGGVVSFLAITNLVTTEIAPMPLLWVAPLALYLLSFVLAFSGRIRVKSLSGMVVFILPVAVIYYFLGTINAFPVLIDLLFYLGLLWYLLLHFHTKLYSHRPPTESLGKFYILMAVGSLLGSVLVTWAIPVFATNHLEYFLALVLMVATLTNFTEVKLSLAKFMVPIFVVFVLFLLPHIVAGFSIIIGAVLTLLLMILFYKWRENYGSVLWVIGMVGVFSPGIESSWENKNYKSKHRNYYGISKVYETKVSRFLDHNGTIHGGQILADEEGRVPLTYYHPGSPVAQVLKNQQNIKSVAIVGLGTGAMATFCGEGTTVDFYELDKDMGVLAEKYFSFIGKSKATINFIWGDARKMLESTNKKYDLIIVDAFNGDAVPTHLLTREALKLYGSRLTGQGVLLMHLTNRFIDLKQVLVNTINMDKTDCYYRLDNQAGNEMFFSEWMSVVPKAFSGMNFKSIGWAKVSPERARPGQAWTDDHNFLLSYIELKNLL